MQRERFLEFVNVRGKGRETIEFPEGGQVRDLLRFSGAGDVEQSGIIGDIEETADAAQHRLLVRYEVLIADRQYPVCMFLRQRAACLLGPHPGNCVQQRVKIVDDRLVHAAYLGARIAQHVQEQQVIEQRHELFCIMHAVKRLVHYNARALLRAGPEQELPDDSMHAARLVLDGLEDLDRIKGGARPLHHACCLQADHINDHLKVVSVVAQVSVQAHQRHEVHNVKRIGRVELRTAVQAQPERVAAAPSEWDHQYGPRTRQ